MAPYHRDSFLTINVLSKGKLLGLDTLMHVSQIPGTKLGLVPASKTSNQQARWQQRRKKLHIPSRPAARRSTLSCPKPKTKRHRQSKPPGFALMTVLQDQIWCLVRAGAWGSRHPQTGDNQHSTPELKVLPPVPHWLRTMGYVDSKVTYFTVSYWVPLVVPPAFVLCGRRVPLDSVPFGTYKVYLYWSGMWGCGETFLLPSCLSRGCEILRSGVDSLQLPILPAPPELPFWHPKSFYT